MFIVVRAYFVIDSVRKFLNTPLYFPYTQIPRLRINSDTSGYSEKTYMHTKFWLEYLHGRDHSEDLGVDIKIILEWILGK